MKFLDLAKLGRRKCSFYFALEQYLLEKESEDLFFFWDIYPSVVIGRHQLIENEINEQFLIDNNVQLYRRPSGGGCVYADDGNFMFSFVSSNTNSNEAFNVYLNKVCEALNAINVKAYKSGRNDLLIDGRKFSGNAFYLKVNRSIMHGTFMYDVDIASLVMAITPSKEKLISKGIESVRQRVVNLKDYVKMSKEEIMAYLASFICDETVYLSEDEIEIVHKKEAKYLTNEWIKGNNPPFSVKKEHRFNSGLVRATYEVKKNKIYNLNLSGDYFSLLEVEDLTKILDNIEYEVEVVRGVLSKIKVEDYIMGLNNEDLINLLFKS